jgi:hypothetical protein
VRSYEHGTEILASVRVIYIQLIALAKNIDDISTSERPLMLAHSLSNLCLRTTETNFGYNLCLSLKFVAFIIAIIKKVNLSLCLFSYALCHEDI